MSDKQMDRLEQAADRLSAELAQAHLALRRIQSEVGYRRRLTAVLLGAVIVVALWLHDEHLDQCGSGTSGGPPAVEVVTEDSSRDFICDVTFPLHNHGSDGKWPALGHGVGVLAWVTLGAGAWWCVRLAR